MSVTLTEAAARHVTRYISKRGRGVGVRLGVKTTGCSGLAYKLEYADEVAPEDIVFEGHGVKVLIDPKSLPYLDGTELDFVREGLYEGFMVRNPREMVRCGCAGSFPAKRWWAGHSPASQSARSTRPSANMPGRRHWAC